MTDTKNDPSALHETAAGEMAASEARLLRQQDARHRVVERRRLIRKFRQALVLDELALYFQPLFSLTGPTLYGVEAQLRLYHARRGMIQAGHLVERLDAPDLIVTVGHWMLQAACQQAALLPPTMKMVLAVSPKYLQSGALADHLLTSLHTTGIAASQLTLLVPEAALLQGNKDIEFALKVAQSLGVKLALDQFGAGYGGVVLLKRFGFSALRLDQEVVAKLAEGREAIAQIEAAVAVGKVVGCGVWADGIEGHEHYNLLRLAGVDVGQGEFLGAAMSAQEVELIASPDAGYCNPP